MIRKLNDGWAVTNVVQLSTDLIRALNGSHGPVTPDGIDDRGPKPVTVRDAVTALRERIDRFMA